MFVGRLGSYIEHPSIGFETLALRFDEEERNGASDGGLGRQAALNQNPRGLGGRRLGGSCRRPLVHLGHPAWRHSQLGSDLLDGHARVASVSDGLPPNHGRLRDETLIIRHEATDGTYARKWVRDLRYFMERSKIHNYAPHVIQVFYTPLLRGGYL